MKKSLLIIPIIILLAGCGGAKQAVKTTQPGKAEPQKTMKVEDYGITLAKFNQCQNGMAYEQVRDIMGVEGRLMGSSEGTGTSSKEYTWLQGNKGANGTFDFVDNKLIGKAQYGLE